MEAMEETLSHAVDSSQDPEQRSPKEDKVVVKQSCTNVSRLRSIFTELRDKSASLCGKLDEMLADISTRETKDGLSWLEVKNHVLLSYLIDSNRVVQTKLKGQSIAQSPSVSRLVEYRTVLERMRPIDHKLKYQLQKMQKIAATGKVDPTDPLRFRADPSAFDIPESKNDNSTQDGQNGHQEGDVDKRKNDFSASSAGGSGKASGSVGVYVPPKLAPVQYLDDETEDARKERQMEKAKRRVLSSSLIAELQREFHEGPLEVREEYNPHKEQLNKRKREREQYEEENFVRIQVSKQERHANRLQGFAVLDDITKFGGGLDTDESFAAKRSKTTSKTKYRKKWGKTGFKGKSK